MTKATRRAKPGVYGPVVGTNLKVVARPGIRSSCSSAQFTPLPIRLTHLRRPLHRACLPNCHLISVPPTVIATAPRQFWTGSNTRRDGALWIQ